jgi:hypothetical protein
MTRNFREFLMNPTHPYRRNIAVPRRTPQRRRVLKAFKRIRVEARKKAEANA